MPEECYAYLLTINQKKSKCNTKFYFLFQNKELLIGIIVPVQYSHYGFLIRYKEGLDSLVLECATRLRQIGSYLSKNQLDQMSLSLLFSYTDPKSVVQYVNIPRNDLMVR